LSLLTSTIANLAAADPVGKLKIFRNANGQFDNYDINPTPANKAAILSLYDGLEKDFLGDDTQYPDNPVTWYHGTNLGAPLSSYYVTNQGVYERDFQYGSVIVNPPGPYKSR
jgi:hypothetical protein